MKAIRFFSNKRNSNIAVGTLQFLIRLFPVFFIPLYLSSSFYPFTYFISFNFLVQPFSSVIFISVLNLVIQIFELSYNIRNLRYLFSIDKYNSNTGTASLSLQTFRLFFRLCDTGFLCMLFNRMRFMSLKESWICLYSKYEKRLR